jgi:hypothetical protein
VRTENLFEANVRVYIAGVLFPHVAVNIVSSFNAMPKATISCPPYTELYGIGREDRVPVHVFMANTMVNDPEEHFILIFEGEVEGFGYSSSSMGREVVINAQSNLTFMKDASIRFLTNIEDMAKMTVLPSYGIGSYATSEFTDITWPYSLFMQGIGTPARKVPGEPIPADDKKGVVKEDNLIKVPFDFLNNVVTMILGEAQGYDTNKNKFSGFYVGYANVLHLDRRFCKVPYFDVGSPLPETPEGTFPILGGLQKNAQVQMLLGRMQQLPKQESFYNIVNYIASNMEFEFAFFSSPYMNGDRLISMALKPLMYEAHPPACNVLYPSIIHSISTSENVYAIPTRVVMRDLSSILANIIARGGEPDPLQLSLVETVYPSDDPEVQKTYVDDPTWGRMLAGEKYTGPWVFEAESPMWTDYLKKSGPEAQTTESEAGRDQLKIMTNRVAAHFLHLKHYENRHMSISCAINPYVTVGFPCIAYDASKSLDGGGWIFAGQVLSVQHSFSAGGASTQVECGFSRLLSDEYPDGIPIENSYHPIYQYITSQPDMCSGIYDALLGCKAVSKALIATDKNKNEVYTYSPAKAYEKMQRQICTYEQYTAWMGYEQGEVIPDAYNRKVPLQFTMGPNHDTKLKGKLLALSKEIYSRKIYPIT